MPNTYIWPTCQKGTPNTHIWSCSKLQSHQKGPTLTYVMEGTESSHHDIMAYPYIWHGRNLILSPWNNGLLLYRPWKEVNTLTMMEWLALTSAMEGTKSSHHDGITCTHIWPGRNQILHPHQKAPHSQTELPGNGPGVSTLPESESCPYIYPTW